MPTHVCWSCCVGVRKLNQFEFLDAVRDAFQLCYVLVDECQDNDKLVMYNLYINFPTGIYKNQLVAVLTKLKCTYSRKSIANHTIDQLRDIRKRVLDQSIKYVLEYGFWTRDVLDETASPIVDDMDDFLEEQEVDDDDPEELEKKKPKVYFKCPLGPVLVEKRTSHLKRIIDDYGDRDDPEYHIRKQRRLEEQIIAKLNNNTHL